MSKKHIADIWIEALRSGEYHQGTNELQSPTGFCCLGVLAVEAEKAGLYTCRRRDDDRITGADLSDQENLRTAISWYNARSTGIIQRSLLEEAFPDKSMPGMDTPSCPGTVSLAQLNDGGFWDFNELADVVEKFKELFFELEGDAGWVEVEESA